MGSVPRSELLGQKKGSAVFMELVCTAMLLCRCCVAPPATRESYDLGKTSLSAALANQGWWLPEFVLKDLTQYPL